MPQPEKDIAEATQELLSKNCLASFVKHDVGKPRPELLPPGALMEIAKVLEYGGRKYAANNWCKGADWSRYLGALQRHILAWAGNEDIDPDTKLNHLGHAGCCLLFLLQYQLSGIGHDDRIGHDIEANKRAG